MRAATYLSERPITQSQAAPLQTGLLLAALVAATVPTALAYHQPPSATLLNQCLALALWGLVAALRAPARLHRSTGLLLAALRRREADGLGVSSTTVAEFLFGMAKSGSFRNRSALQ